tara:strand:+ start:240 stop:1040 length:801 start_codon:yes stop_codon:yes gene_type:complete
MPVAESFNALGEGTGFRDCRQPKVNISTTFTEKWTTLSGFNSDSVGAPSEEEIHNSLVLAMQLFWNPFKITGQAQAAWSFGSTSYSKEITSGENEVDYQPKRRACFSSSKYPYKMEDDFILTPDPWLPDYTYEEGVRVEMSCYPVIYKLYNGLTNDEDNFIGYGATIDRAVVADHLGFLNIYNSIDLEFSASTTNTDYQDFCTIQGTQGSITSAFHFVASRFDDSSVPDEDRSIDLSVPGFSWSYSSPSNSGSASLRIDGFDFYTY